MKFDIPTRKFYRSIRVATFYRMVRRGWYIFGWWYRSNGYSSAIFNIFQASFLTKTGLLTNIRRNRLASRNLDENVILHPHSQNSLKKELSLKLATLFVWGENHAQSENCTLLGEHKFNMLGSKATQELRCAFIAPVLLLHLMHFARKRREREHTYEVILSQLQGRD